MGRTRLTALALATTVLVGAAAGTAWATTMTTSNADQPATLDTFVRHCTDLYNQRDWANLQAHCYDTASFVDHTPEPGQAPTYAGFKSSTNSADTAFPDWKTTIVELTAQGDRVVMLFAGAGTQTGPLGKLPATGHSVRITGMRMFRIQHGRITDTWVNYDKLGLLQQLGVVPSF